MFLRSGPQTVILGIAFVTISWTNYIEASPFSPPKSEFASNGQLADGTTWNYILKAEPPVQSSVRGANSAEVKEDTMVIPESPAAPVVIPESAATPVSVQPSASSPSVVVPAKEPAQEEEISSGVPKPSQCGISQGNVQQEEIVDSEEDGPIPPPAPDSVPNEQEEEESDSSDSDSSDSSDSDSSDSDSYEFDGHEFEHYFPYFPFGPFGPPNLFRRKSSS